MQKDWCTNFKVKVMMRVDISKIWPFLLYLVNCWSLYNRLSSVIHHYKPKCLVKKFDCFIQGISSEPQNLLWPNLVWWCVIMIQCIMQKDWCINFKVKVQSNYDSLYCVFWTAHLYAIRLTLMVWHYKLEYLVRKLYCFVQGQGHNDVQDVSECLSGWYQWYAVFKVEATVKAHLIKIRLFNISSDLLILLQPHLE